MRTKGSIIKYLPPLCLVSCLLVHFPAAAGALEMLDPADISANLRMQIDQSAELLADPGVEAIRTGDLAAFREAVPDAEGLKTFGPGRVTYLHLAALEGEIGIAEYLVGLGARVNQRERQTGMTPLLYAILANRDAVVLWLLEAGAKADGAVAHGYRPVHFAAMFCGVTVVEALAGRGADIQAVTDDGMTPVLLAAALGKTDLMEWLAAQGVPLDATEGLSPLQLAAFGDRADTVLALVERGVDIEWRGLPGAPTPLGLAALQGGLTTAAILLEHGAQANVVDQESHSPLTYAVMATNRALVELLVDHGADVHVRDAWNRTLLINSVYSDDPEFIRFVFSLDQDVHARGAHGADALFHAAWKGKNRAIETLLDLGANPSTHDDDGVSALMKAAEMGNLEGATLLVEAGADIDAMRDNGKTALLYAAEPENREVFLYLLDRGAELFPEGQAYWPVTLMLAWDGHAELLKDVVDRRKPDLNWRTDGPHHQSALYLAVRATHPEVVALLLEEGADPAISNGLGLTPWHLAELLDDRESAALLADRMTPEDRMPTNRVRIYYDLDAPLASEVYLAGTFNDWEYARNPMTRREDDGWWHTELDVFPLWYDHAFYVDDAWREDPLGTRNNPGEIHSRTHAETRRVGDRPVRPRSVAPELFPATFTYVNATARRVYLAGEFNGWNNRNLPMRLSRVGEWWITHELPAGEHAYKFVVDGEWIRDPANRETKEVDGVINSMIRVPVQEEPATPRKE